MMRFFTIFFASLVLIGCNGAKQTTADSFKQPVQNFLNTKGGLCMEMPAKSLPYQVPYKSMYHSEQYIKSEVLKEMGMLTRKDVEKNNRYDPDLYEYDVSDEGKVFLKNPGTKYFGFCSGNQKLLSIDNFTEPSDNMGLKVSHVSYTYTYENVEELFMKKINDGVKRIATNFNKEYPETIEIPGQERSKSVFVSTDKGWMEESFLK